MENSKMNDQDIKKKYTDRLDKNDTSRSNMKTVHLRNFHNWIKAVLID